MVSGISGISNHQKKWSNEDSSLMMFDGIHDSYDHIEDGVFKMSTNGWSNHIRFCFPWFTNGWSIDFHGGFWMENSGTSWIHRVPFCGFQEDFMVESLG